MTEKRTPEEQKLLDSLIDANGLWAADILGIIRRALPELAKEAGDLKRAEDLPAHTTNSVPYPEGTASHLKQKLWEHFWWECLAEPSSPETEVNK